MRDGSLSTTWKKPRFLAIASLELDCCSIAAMSRVSETSEIINRQGKPKKATSLSRDGGFFGWRNQRATSRLSEFDRRLSDAPSTRNNFLSLILCFLADQA